MVAQDYDPDDDRLIIEPIEPEKKSTGRQQDKKSVEISVPKRTEIPPIKSSGGKPKEYQKYVCLRCRYKFTRKSGSGITLRCPYCGKADVEEDTFDINKAISEVE